MNPDLPHNLREELEARLSALLLGELSADDAELLHKLIAHDPELAKLHDQLKLTIELVRETASDPIEQSSPQAAPLKLSEEKREKLLAQFKTVTPEEFTEPRRSRSLLVHMSIAATAVLVILGGLAALFAPMTRSFRGYNLMSSISSSEEPQDTAAPATNAVAWSSVSPAMTVPGGGNAQLDELLPSRGSRQVAGLPPPVSAANAPRTTIVLPNAGKPAENQLPALASADSYDRYTFYRSVGAATDPDTDRYRHLSELNFAPRPPVSVATTASDNTRAGGEKARATENSSADFFANRNQQNVPSKGEQVAGVAAQDRGPFGGFGGRGGELARMTTNYVVTAGAVERSVGLEGRGEDGRTRRLQVTELASDPEWIGTLERPDRPHTNANQFVGHYAYMVTPPGSGIDANYLDLNRNVAVPAQQPVSENTWDLGSRFFLAGGDDKGNGGANKTVDLSRSGLETRTFHVDPNTLYQGLENVGALNFSKFTGGQTMVAGGGGMGGGGGGGFGGGGAAGRGGGGGGLAFVTQTNGPLEVQDSVRKFYSAAGVELDPKSGKDVFYNDRTGELTVRGTARDLETIAAANETLAIAPPEINVRAKFVEARADNRALGLDWVAGDQLADVRREQEKVPFLGDTPALGRFRGEGQVIINSPHIVSSSNRVIDAENLAFGILSTNSVTTLSGVQSGILAMDVVNFTNAGTLTLNGGSRFDTGLTRDDVGGLRYLYDAKQAGQKQTAVTLPVNNANPSDVLSALQATVGASSHDISSPGWALSGVSTPPVYSAGVVGYYDDNLKGAQAGKAEIPVKYAKAGEIAPALNSMAGANAATHSAGAATETERARRSNIVLPSIEPGAQAGKATVSADASGNLVVIGDNTTIEQIRRTVAALDRPAAQTIVGTTLMDVQQQGSGATKLRNELKVTESDPMSLMPTPTLSTETVRQLQSSLTMLKAVEASQGAQLKALTTLPPEKQLEVLQVVLDQPDAELSRLANQAELAKQNLVKAERNYASDSPNYVTSKKIAEESDKKINDRLQDLMTGLQAKQDKTKATVEQLSQQLESATAKDLAMAANSRPYYAAAKDLAVAANSAPYYAGKQKLQDLVDYQRLLGMKMASEKTDLSLPKSAMVEIVERATAQPTQSLSLGQKIRGLFSSEIERGAQVQLERNVSDIDASGKRSNVAQAYDPYFIQTEFETIQSEAVLGKVVQDLKLNEAWAGKNGGRTLKTQEAVQLLKQKLDVKPIQNTSRINIGVKSDKPEEAAKLANAIAEAYRAHRMAQSFEMMSNGIAALQTEWAQTEKKVAQAKAELDRVQKEFTGPQTDVAPPKPATPLPIPQPEIQTSDNAFSTFSLNVSDVSFKLAAASLGKNSLPDPASIRSEEFINAFDYRDPEAAPGAAMAFVSERARYPFAYNRDLLRFSVKTVAMGRQAGRPLNLVLLLDNSGSMERADRVGIIREALRVLASQLQPQDTISVVTFSRTARLWVDGRSGSQAGDIAEGLSELTPQGGTNLEDAMNLAYATALRHYLADGINRVVLLTDGAANLGDVDPDTLKQKVEAHRKQGIALDCFGIGWEGYNDDLLEVLSRNGDGRYGFINSPEEASTEFAAQLAGALQVAASDVKVQVEFNPKRVTSYRQIGYAKHQLTKEQFRDNTVDAAEIASQEAGNALYTVEVNPAGEGPLCTVHVRYRIPGTGDYREQEWAVPFTGNAIALEQSSPAMRLAATASAFSEWLATSPYAAEVTTDRLLNYLTGVPEIYGADVRPKKLEWMIRQAKSISGK